MSLPTIIGDRLSLPAICAPMFMVSTPQLVQQACLAGIIGALPRHNARSIEEFEKWLQLIDESIQVRRAEAPDAKIGPIAVNLASNLPVEETERNLALCKRYGVEIIINATGNPAELTKRAHDHGMLVYADAVSVRFAEKAIACGVDGVTAIGWGGGGHSGTISHLALVAAIRERFEGTLIMAGGIATGAAIRAAEVLGADLAYLGTRFIATTEAAASDEYKAMLVSETSSGLQYTPKIAGVAANWLDESIRLAGLDPKNLPMPESGKPGYDHLPATARPWHNIWSAGQGIDQIYDIPATADLVARLRDEYRVASQIPVFPGATE